MSPLTSHLAEARARQTLRDSRLPFDGPLRRASSTHNEVHLTDQHVVKVSAIMNTRLRREAYLSHYLPRHPWSPTAVAAGERAGTDFLIIERKPGQPLAHSWPFLSIENRRLAVSQLAAAMRAIHATPAPPPNRLPPIGPTMHLIDDEDEDPSTSGGPPVRALFEGLERLAADPNADRGVVTLAQDYVRDHQHHLAPFDRSRLLHGDLTFENILHDGRRVSAIIDFEWCRGGPPDLDLDVILRCCALPEAHVAARYQDLTRSEDYAPIPGWLAEDYPEAFADPNLASRLTLYALAYDVRQALEEPLPVHRVDVDDLHPYNRLVSLVSTGGHVAAMLAAVGLAV